MLLSLVHEILVRWISFLSLQQHTKLLDDDDAVVISRKWFREMGAKLKISHVVKAIESLGLVPVTKGSTFRQALVHFGNELTKNDLVILKKKAGLTKDDVIIE